MYLLSRAFASSQIALILRIMPHGPESLLIELFAIFVAAKMCGEIFERIS